MSRNLGSVFCRVCSVEPRLIEAPRLVTEAETGSGYFQHYKDNLEVANADCVCGAKYLAWVRFRQKTPGSGHLNEEPSSYMPFIDMSWRTSFDDEPAAADLPPPETLARFAAEGAAKYVRDLRKQAAQLHEQAEILLRAAEEYERTPIAPHFLEFYRR